MGLKDLFKDVTDLAKDSIDSIQADLALKKEEQERLRAAMELRIKIFTDTLLGQLMNNIDPLARPFIDTGDAALVAFTEDFSLKLLLPANGSSATKIDMHPYEENILKNVLKTFTSYHPQEKFLFQFKDSQGQIILVTTANLYFKIVFPENASFYSIGSIPKEKLIDIGISRDDQQFQLLVNNVPLISTPAAEIQNFDYVTLSEYLRRIKAKDFAIDEDQISAFISLKLDPTTLEITNKFIDNNEKLVYFAWGLDSLSSKKFIICTDHKIILYDRELNTDKCFNYDEITSISTQKNTVSFLDLSLTLGMNPNDTEIHTADGVETIHILYSREAERLIQVYNHYKSEASPRTTQANSDVQPETADDQQPSIPLKDPIAMIEKLAVLKEKGMITEEEFNQKKKDLLEKL
ncbi:SHOCT domain-containing protein [Acetobacterium paludosum]|nr:SHOCT domain-containing protein [Acetobacterium paludosum]